MRLALAAIIVLSSLLLLLITGLLRVWLRLDKKKAELDSSEDNRASSPRSEIQTQQKQNINRRVIYYSLPLIFQYVQTASLQTNVRLFLCPILYSPYRDLQIFLQISWHRLCQSQAALFYYFNISWAVDTIPLRASIADILKKSQNDGGNMMYLRTRRNSRISRTVEVL